jgi:RNase P/RNase MRP subunit p29
MKELIGKKVRLIVMLGDTSVPFEGILKEADQWIVLETKGKKKVINRDAVVYAEEKE